MALNTIPEPDDNTSIIPVIFLIDISGSMRTIVPGYEGRPTGETITEDGQRYRVVEGGKSRIDVVNENLRELFKELRAVSMNNNEIDVSIIAFGDHASCVLNLCAVEQAQWVDMEARGGTNLADALRLAKSIIDDPERKLFPNHCGRPSIVLVSDGKPNTGWERPLQDFVTNGRTAKCDRFALGIGPETNRETLKAFIHGDESGHLFDAQNATEIIQFFRYISTRTQDKSRTMGAKTVPGARPAISVKPFTVVKKKQDESGISTPSPKKKNPFMQ